MDRVEPVGQEFRPREDDSTRDLIAQLLRQGTELVKKEVELARSEMNVQVKSMVAMSTGFGIAAVLAVVGIVLLCGAAVFGLANAMPLWAAALIVGVVVLAIAGIMMSVAKKKIVRNPFERTRRTLKETLQWARERMA
jgi:uncharacterized membrane protein YqjE